MKQALCSSQDWGIKDLPLILGQSCVALEHEVPKGITASVCIV